MAERPTVGNPQYSRGRVCSVCGKPIKNDNVRGLCAVHYREFLYGGGRGVPQTEDVRQTKRYEGEESA